MSETNLIAAKRVQSLDYLRGVTAVCVMLYHFVVWTKGPQEVDTFLGKAGIYGVSVFYILSGLTLCLVYEGRTLSWKSINEFAIKRIFRIFPLLWLSIALTIVLKYYQHKPLPDYWSLWLNITGLFGFLQPGAYLSTGAWSVGNELVFYALFPFMLWLLKKKRLLFYLFWVLTCCVTCFFSFYKLNVEIPLSKQWATYINPFNQLFFFVGGMAIGTFGEETLTIFRYQSGRRIFFIMGLSFILYPVEGNQITIVSGLERIIFSTLSFGICTSFYAFKGKYILQQVDEMLGFLGEISYSLYLLHPLVFLGLREVTVSYLSSKEHFVISLFLTFFISYLSYNVIEKPCVRLGKYILK